MAASAALGISGVALLVGLAAGAVVSPPAVQAFLYNREGRECWDPNVKLSATELAKATAANIFRNTIPSTIPADGKNKLEASFDVKLDSFFVMAASPQVAAIQCGAAMSYSYTNLDGAPTAIQRATSSSSPSIPEKGAMGRRCGRLI